MEKEIWLMECDSCWKKIPIGRTVYIVINEPGRPHLCEECYQRYKSKYKIVGEGRYYGWKEVYIEAI